MSRIDTNEPNRLIAAAIEMALPHGGGYLLDLRLLLMYFDRAKL